MDTHHKIAAWLRLLTSGLFLALLVLIVVLVATYSTEIAESLASDPDFDEFGDIVTALLWIGLIFMVALTLAEIVISILFLRGTAWAKYGLMAFAGLGLFNIPFGTALGIYSLWALTRDIPQPTGSLPPGTSTSLM